MLTEPQLTRTEVGPESEVGSESEAGSLAVGQLTAMFEVIDLDAGAEVTVAPPVDTSYQREASRTPPVDDPPDASLRAFVMERASQNVEKTFLGLTSVQQAMFKRLRCDQASAQKKMYALSAAKIMQFVKEQEHEVQDFYDVDEEINKLRPSNKGFNRERQLGRRLRMSRTVVKPEFFNLRQDRDMRLQKKMA